LSWPDYLAIARGNADGLSSDDKFGQNLLVGTAYSVISIGGIYRVPQVGPFPPLTDYGYLAKVQNQTGQVSVLFDYILVKVA